MAEKSGKKLINSVDSCVDDNLEGYVALNPGVRLLKGQRVIIRADFEELQRAGKVAVVCGGGSGHEPAFSGYVGRGMLAAAAMGSVFASPPPSTVLAAVRAVTKHNPAGCLLLIPNYTGDRLNFGPAAERAQREGMRVATVIVGEDCAQTARDKSAGRRGLTGIPVCIKIAGALAEEGRRLEDIAHIVSTALANMATIGVALTPCSVPGSGPTFTLPPDEMELGLGVHGEAGVRRLKVMTAKETVAAMLDHMTSTDNTNRLTLQKGDRVAVFINDLGGISHVELNIMAKEAIAYLESTGVKVVRALCSPFMTSLEMAGTHVTVLRLDDDITHCLDAPTLAPHWPRPLLPEGVTDRCSPAPLQLDYVNYDPTTDVARGVTLTAEEGGLLQSMVRAACQAVLRSEPTLNMLDTEAGDGDCGSTMARGARGVVEELCARESGAIACRPAQLAHRLAQIAESVMGGASGGLYSVFFTGVSTALSQEHVDDTWTQALKQGVDMVVRYGGAEPGDRTMLDALQPALDSLAATVGSPATHRFQQAVLAAQKGAESTRTMKARAGRASYVRASLQHLPDPGAVGVVTWLSAACDVYSDAKAGQAI
ncbi:triokinase/FMN cyclase-like [Babylonia areolata]|uniref:triokinase/FMN cyclase-like n=1 Tax=Babylonia areolata TaxID=304850 RepID=UPI003FCF19BC